MLVLTRRNSEWLRITTPDGYTIDVQVVEIQTMGQVRLGIEADRACIVHRDNIRQDKPKERRR